MKKILILEDNLQTAQKLARIIKRMEFKVHIEVVNSIEAAYNIALEKTIDVFFVDIILVTTYPGDTSGIRFVQNIREVEKYYFTPIIFVTALADPELYAYKNLNCFGYIEKPFEEQQIVKLLKRALFYKTPTNEEKKVYLRKDGILYSVSIKSIVCIQVRNHKMYIYMDEGEMEIPYKTIKLFLQENDCDELIQCNRYPLINKEYVENVDFVNRFIRLRGKKDLVEIGMVYKKNLWELFYDYREC